MEITNKALPMSRQVLGMLLSLSTVSRSTKLAMLLAFKTGSRVGDIFHLEPRKALQAVPGNKLLICWGITKSHHTVQARDDHQQLVDSPGSLLELLEDPLHLERTSPAKIDAALRNLGPSKAYVHHWQEMNKTVKIRPHFSKHSFKRGRAAELWALAAKGDITVERVMFELKHKSIEAALAYAPSPLHTAQAMRLRNEQVPQQPSSKRRPRRPN